MKGKRNFNVKYGFGFYQTRNASRHVCVKQKSSTVRRLLLAADGLQYILGLKTFPSNLTSVVGEVDVMAVSSWLMMTVVILVMSVSEAPAPESKKGFSIS